LKEHSIFLLLLVSLISIGSANAQQFELLYDTPEENNFIDVIEEDSSFLLIGNQGKVPNNTPSYLRINKKGLVLLDSMNQKLTNFSVRSILEKDSSYLLVYSYFSSPSIHQLPNNDTSIQIIEVNKSFTKTLRTSYILKDSVNNWFPFNAKLIDNNMLMIVGSKRTFSTNEADGFALFYNLDTEDDTVIFLQRPHGILSGANEGLKIGSKYYVSATVDLGSYNVKCKSFIHLFRYNSDLSLDTVFEVCNSKVHLGLGPFFPTNLHFNNSMVSLSDTTFAVVARINNFDSTVFSPEPRDIGYVILDTNFTEINSEIIEKPDSFALEGIRHADYYSAMPAFYVGGTERFVVNSTGYDTSDTYFMLRRADLEGNPLCTRLYSNSTYLQMRKVLATSDGGALMVGTSYDEKTANGLEKDAWIVKVDSNGNYQNVTSLEENPSIPEEDFAFYPNPFKEQIIFQQFNRNRKLQMQLFDLQGRKILEKSLWESQVEIDLSGLSRGTYIYRLMDESGKSASGKLMKQ